MQQADVPARLVFSMMTSIHVRQYDKAVYEELIQAGIKPLMARLYAARSVRSSSEINHSLACLLPFDQLKNCQAMAERLADAIKDQQNILIVGDYDADGATACAVAMEGLSQLGAQVSFIIPNRFEYGYGLTQKLVEFATTQKPDILLTVDNGISSVEGVAYAQKLGVEVLITDHHLPLSALPAALIVNPNQPGCLFASKNLTGVGVIFYVLLALRAHLRLKGAFADKKEPNMALLLDWVAMGTISDVARLDQNNRILVEQGLRLIRSGRMHMGTEALFKVAKKDPQQASSFDLGYAICPRLNAAGRMDDMTAGVHCLLSKDQQVATTLAEGLNALNVERRVIQSQMKTQALMDIHQKGLLDRYTLSLFSEGWHPGVVGLLAGYLKDQFCRPVVVFAASDNGNLSGSGRSISGFHLCEALSLINEAEPGLLRRFGGHEMAVGLSIARDDLARFSKAFEAVAKKTLTQAMLKPSYKTDGHLNNDEMDFEMACLLKQQVWGKGFEEPLFCDGFTVLSQNRVAEKHLKLLLQKDGESFEAIFFNTNSQLPERIEAVYQMMPNTFRNRQSVQLYIKHWFVGR